MKRIIFVSALSLFSCLAFAQSAIDQAMLDQAKKDKDKSDKSIQDEKTSAKAATWMERAQLYQNIALQYSQLDSNAAMAAYDAYKKVVELDKTKKGDPGRSAKEAQDVLNGADGTNLYTAFVKQGAEKYQAKNMTDALKMFQMAQQINQKDTTAALYGGISAQQADMKDIAVEQFEKYATNGGTDPSVFYGLAQLYRADNKFDKAISTLERGLTKSPDNKDLKSEIVNIHLASGNEDMAINQLKELTAKDPSNVTNMVNLAILYDNSAIKQGTKIRELQDKMGASGNTVDSKKKQLADENGKIDVFQNEVKRITALMKKQPKNADLKRQLDEVNQSMDAAKANVTKYEGEVSSMVAKATSGDQGAMQKEMTDLKTQYNQYRDLSIETYKKALTAEPENYDALFNLGVFYFNDAVELKREVDNMNMTEYQQRGKEVEGRVCGKFQRAKPYFEKALKVRPDEEEAKSTLENVNNILTQFSEKKVVCVTE